MVKSCFFSIGLFVTLCGASLLFVDKLILNVNEDPQQESAISSMFSSVTPERQNVIDPPEWDAFRFMSGGAVTMLYAVALPKKKE